MQKIETSPTVTFLNKKSAVSATSIWGEITHLHDQKRKVERMLGTLEPEIHVKFSTDRPVRIIPINDFHLFSTEADLEKADHIFGLLDESSTYGVVMGDFIEGSHPGIAGHRGGLELSLGLQIVAAKMKLEPYVKAGKILCMVGGFNGHEGWGDRLMGLEMVQNMVSGLVGPDGKQLQVIINGGKLIAHMADGTTCTFLLYHDAGGGGSDEVNPLGALRSRLWERRHNEKLDVVGGAHRHHRARVSEEVSLDRRKNKEETAILFASATIKGNDPDHQDPFLAAQAKDVTLAPGVSLVLHQRRRKDNGHQTVIWPSYGFKRGERLYDAAKLWNEAERIGATEELIGRIHNRNTAPVSRLNHRHSRLHTKEHLGQTPYYETVEWDISNPGGLPVKVDLVTNTRHGSHSHLRDRAILMDIIKGAEEDPYVFVLLMRHLIDPSVASRFDRLQILDSMAGDFRGLNEKGKVLGVMMSSSLRQKRWTKDVVKKTEQWDRHKRKYYIEKEIAEALYPGDYLFRYSALRRVPLYLNDSVVTLNFDQNEFPIEVLDHLARSGSSFDPFRGLVQARRKTLTDTRIVTGGHMPGAGYLEGESEAYIAPGWLADCDSGGRANMVRAPMGGQSVTLLTRQNIIVPAATIREGRDLFKALTLDAGMTDREKSFLMGKRQKVRR